MSVELLTLDNPLLSSLNYRDLAYFGEINCTPELSEEVLTLVRGSLSEATKRAYRSDLQHFEKAGWKVPALPEHIAQYLASQAKSSSVATLKRRLASLSKVHRSLGFPNPTTAELVKATLMGLRRTIGVKQRQANPLLKDELLIVLEASGPEMRAVRDRALLLLGFSGGLRRSELVSFDRSDIERVRQGFKVTIRRSKTDQEGAGRIIGIPTSQGRWCPVSAMEEWLTLSQISDGPVFRPINKHAHIGESRLSGAAVCFIIRERLVEAGINPCGYSGHSLRAGLATSAALAGVSLAKIRQQTGHASDAMLARYVRDSELFLDNAVSNLL